MSLSVERMCALAGLSRAAYYRGWAASEPRREETALRDTIQRLALAHRFYGYRRIGELLRRGGLGDQPQAGAAADARGQSVVPQARGRSGRRRRTRATAGRSGPTWHAA